jgi:hypothetical protein
MYALMNIYEICERNRDDDLNIIRRYIAAIFMPDNDSKNTNMVIFNIYYFTLAHNYIYDLTQTRFFCGEP